MLSSEMPTGGGCANPANPIEVIVTETSVVRRARNRRSRAPVRG
jgi:hypothetical protein